MIPVDDLIWTTAVGLVSFLGSILATQELFYAYHPEAMSRRVRYNRFLFPQNTPEAAWAGLGGGVLFFSGSILFAALMFDLMIIAATAFAVTLVILFLTLVLFMPLLLNSRPRRVLPKWRQEQLRRGEPYSFPVHPDDADLVSGDRVRIVGLAGPRPGEAEIVIERPELSSERRSQRYEVILEGTSRGFLDPGSRVRVGLPPGRYELYVAVKGVRRSPLVDIEVPSGSGVILNFERTPTTVVSLWGPQLTTRTAVSLRLMSGGHLAGDCERRS
jgi:hypothetical protein